MNIRINKIYLLIFFWLPGQLYAYDVGTTGIGGVAVNALEPVSLLSSFMASAALAIGITFVVAAFFKYIQHRRNPLAHPISTVVFWFILGLILLCLPLVYKLTESGVPNPYHF